MRRSGRNLTIALGTLVVLTLIAGAGCRRQPRPSPELQSLLAAEILDRRVSDAGVRDALRAFYAETGETLAWTGRSGPSKQADAAVALLASAERFGLAPADYHAADLSAERAVVRDAPASERKKRVAIFDIRVTEALLRFGRDLASGRVDARTIDAAARPRREQPDLGATLAASRTDLDAWIEQIEPRHPEYVRLKEGLAALRGAAAKGGWATVPRRVYRPGAAHPGVAVLRARLAASGDLGAARVEGQRYDDELARAVRVFQEHHGLPPTGHVDARTLAVLNVPLQHRIRQVEINLDRWRWLPDDLGARHFRVNIPYFHLEAYEDGELALDIRAVVGKKGNETPIFSDEMTHVVMSPYWNIPPTIAADETLPAVSKDPTLLERQSIEVVRVSGTAVDPVDPASIDWNDAEALEGLRFRQRPGAGNALGLVKFLFPNEHDVYVHDTPADALFSRLGRAFSHGCVRVEEPLTLAEYVLAGEPRWTTATIDAAMHAGTETHVKLKSPIPIHIVYFTAWVDRDGGLHFRDDVYGYDAKQMDASKVPQKRRPSRPKPETRPDGGDAVKIARMAAMGKRG
jgi:murein L,D-transpeptidase YcbB/YkuD